MKVTLSLNCHWKANQRSLSMNIEVCVNTPYALPDNTKTSQMSKSALEMMILRHQIKTWHYSRPVILNKPLVRQQGLKRWGKRLRDGDFLILLFFTPHLFTPPLKDSAGWSDGWRVASLMEGKGLFKERCRHSSENPCNHSCDPLTILGWAEVFYKSLLIGFYFEDVVFLLVLPIFSLLFLP